MNHADRAVLTGLLRTQRHAALGTVGAGVPFVSLVPYALIIAPPSFSLIIQISGLAAHTRHLAAEPRASLLVYDQQHAAADEADPLQVPRLTLEVLAEPLDPADLGYAEAKAAYLARFANAGQLFALADFRLVRLTPQAARYVGGFARALSLSAEALASLFAPPAAS